MPKTAVHYFLAFAFLLAALPAGGLVCVSPARFLPAPWPVSLDALALVLAAEAAEAAEAASRCDLRRGKARIQLKQDAMLSIRGLSPAFCAAIRASLLRWQLAAIGAAHGTRLRQHPCGQHIHKWLLSIERFK